MKSSRFRPLGIAAIVLSFWCCSLPIVYSQTPHTNHGTQEADKADPHLHHTEEQNTIVIPTERLQSIGMTYEPARRQMMEKTIQTVGHVEVDERLEAHVHVRFDGWIEKLLVNFTGEKVRKGQGLFTVYSPELVATQQEYLLALHAVNIMNKGRNAHALAGAKSALNAARQRLLLWGVSEDTIRQLRKTEKVSRTITIDSPIQGTVTHKKAVAGLRIKPGIELYTIADLSRLWIQADIYEYELPFIHLDQQAEITLSYLPQQVFHARTSFIDPVVDPKTRTIRVRFEVDNQDEALKPGMYADIRLKIPLGKRLAVPRNAVLLTGKRAIIFIYHGNGKIEWREATLGVQAGDWVEITHGLRAGEDIITSANFLIDSESQLKNALKGMEHVH